MLPPEEVIKQRPGFFLPLGAVAAVVVTAPVDDVQLAGVAGGDEFVTECERLGEGNGGIYVAVKGEYRRHLGVELVHRRKREGVDAEAFGRVARRR